MKNIYNLQKYFYIFKSYYLVLFYYRNIILLFFICKELINLNYVLEIYLFNLYFIYLHAIVNKISFFIFIYYIKILT